MLTANLTETDRAVHARRWKLLAVLALSLVIIGLDNTLLNVALPTLQQHFDASGSTLQWIVDAYLLSFAGLLLTMGTLGDRFGRKRALQLGLIVFGGASIAAALATSAGALVALRATMGVGAALIMPATLSIIINIFEREERRKAIAIWAAMAGVGIGLGPFIGGLALEWFSWSVVFWINVPIVAVALVAGARLIPESRDPAAGSFDLVGAALSVAGLVVLVFAIIEAPSRDWTDLTVDAAFAGAAALGAIFVWWERRVADPMLQVSFFRDARFSVASAGIACVSFAMLGGTFALTQYLQFAHGYSALQAGAAMLPLAVGLVIGSGNSHRLVGRLGSARVIAGGLAGIAAVLASSVLWTPDTTIWILGFTIFGLALSIGSVLAPATDSVMGAVPDDKAGVGSAMNDVTRQVGGALGVAVVGSIVTSSYAHHLPHGTTGAAHDSIGAAHTLAARIGGGAGDQLLATANSAFTEALGMGLLAAAAVAAAGAILVRFRLPAEAAPVEPAADPAAGSRGRRGGPAPGHVTVTASSHVG